MWRWRGRTDEDFSEEIQANIALDIDRFIAEGMTPADARAAALRTFGNVTRAQERFYESHRVMWLDDVQRDVRYTLRTLLKTPGFTAIVVLTLALGIGANTAIFSVVNAVLLRPLPYKDADRLVRIFGSVSPGEGSHGPARRVPMVGVSELPTLRAQAQTLSHVIFYMAMSATLTGRDEAVRLAGNRISPDAFPMLGAHPIIGRTFEAGEALSGADTVVILSYASWQRYFDGTRDVLGKGLMLDGRGYSVIGVMAPGFQFPDPQTQFWVPFVPTDFSDIGGAPVARLKDGVSLQAATAEVGTILQQLRAKRPASDGPPGPRFSGYELVGLQDLLVAPVRPALLVLAGAVGLVLLIACVNVANLLLARSAGRQREMAVRLALGAGRSRLVRQALTESVLLALVGGFAGMGLAYGGVRLLQTLGTGLVRRDVGLGVGLPRLDEIGIDASVLAFTLGASVLTGLVFGLAPAIRQSRTGPMDMLREATGSATSGFNLLRHNRMQGLLVVAEIAMTMILFVGGGLLIHSVVNLSHVAPGYNPTHLLTAQLSLPQGRYPGAQLIAFADNVTAQLQRLPGVRAAGYAWQLPMIRTRQLTVLRTTPEMPTPMPVPPPFDARQLPQVPDMRVVSREFLKAMGVRLVAGRGFGENDAAGQAQVMLINQTLARSGFLGEHPIGRQIYAKGPAPWQIVGIVEDVRQFDLDQDPDPQVFIDNRQDPPPQASRDGYGAAPAPYFAVRTDIEPLSVASSFRGLVRQLEPQATVDNIATMEQLVSNSLSRPRLYAVLLGIFAGVAVALTVIGIYGVMAYSVAQRIREIGIRMALGAQRADVIKLVLGQSLVLTAVGVVCGIGGALGVTRYLDNMLFGLTPFDPLTFITVSLMFGSVATLAAFVPARRATTVDPLVALRCE
jgi:predicted permease